MNEKHTTLYRAYRPQSFDQMRGQDVIVNALQQAIKSHKIAHAYIFSGGRGTGKTTTARIFARALGVSDKDIIEMDAASNRGIDDIRELREGVWVSPFESPYKVYIIDEAHMLTKEAWNALLKTLEEPPTHVIFILATTERDKIPDTIQSRCELYMFREPTQVVLTELVISVAQSEGYTIEKSAAEKVAQLAEGSFRDALSVLQKVLTTAPGTDITVSHVEKASGVPREELVCAFVSALAAGDSSAALASVAQASRDNVDMRTFARACIVLLRAVLLARFAPTQDSMLSQSDRELVDTLKTSKNITSDTLRRMLEAHAQMGYATVPTLPLELVVVDVCK